jgi:hypothetical protein
MHSIYLDRLCGLVVKVLGYRSGGPGSILGTTRKRSSGSGTGSTQPREYNWGATWYKSSGSCLENREYGRRDPSRWPRGTLYPQMLAITSPTSGGRSVGIVRSQTQTMEVFFNSIWPSLACWARSGNVMCFLWGTDNPIELSWVLNKRQDGGYVQNCDSYINITSSQTYR